MGEKVNNWVWDGLTNRILECDKILPRTLRILRIIGVFIMTQSTIFAFVADDVVQTKGMLYFTGWGVCLQFLLYVFFMLAYLCPQSNFIWKTTHLLCEITMSLGVVICLVFWAVIVPVQENVANPNTVTLIFVNVEVHGLTYGWLYLDFYFNRIEFVWKHLVIIMSLGVAYLILCSVYTTVTGSLLYPNVDWNGWFTAVFVIIATSLLLAAFSLCLCISRRKQLRYYRVTPAPDSARPLETVGNKLNEPAT